MAERGLTPLTIAAPAFGRDPDDDHPGSHSTARPIFVLGSLRSGASLLTWSLGQHPNILPLLETNWLGHFAVALQQAYALGVQRRHISQFEAMGLDPEDFFAYHGDAIDRLFLGSGGAANGALAAVDRPAGRDGNGLAHRSAPAHAVPRRWVDGSIDNCFNLVGLRRLFPGARFIHVLRDARSEVAVLTDEGGKAIYRSHHVQLTEEAAYEHWLTTVRACVAAERAFGSSVVLRLRREDLIADPEAALRRCLAFVGEPFSSACLRPFS